LNKSPGWMLTILTEKNAIEAKEISMNY